MLFELCIILTVRDATLFKQRLFNGLLQHTDALFHIGRIITSFQAFLRKFVTNIQRGNENQLFSICDSSANFEILQPLVKIVRRHVQRILLFWRAIYP
ncbi:Uncharacterised protein [Serratia rubidaea]|uniref:Uncharacterized protein n=1 Tax=Serratia rubidaea TaxID=61652 RepID=A0A447QIM3_SERRU|nr:Uncharacterised protein [Serratia rubidaea]CAI1967439.1 Uncharacterised protein [Serratia rubidaea]VEA69856.1 Uncharacterised protein [Serratia rubidaea]VTP66561.1 Uncharacterised protein [Serratia rubidaea]